METKKGTTWTRRDLLIKKSEDNINVKTGVVSGSGIISLGAVVSRSEGEIISLRTVVSRSGSGIISLPAVVSIW